MASRKYLFPLLQLLFAAVSSFRVELHPGACHALHRQTPLTMTLGFRPPNRSNMDSSSNNVHGSNTVCRSASPDEQCLEPLERIERQALAAVASPSAAETDSDHSSAGQHYRRSEAQRCLVSSAKSLTRRQQQLAPEGKGFPCASKPFMANSPPAAVPLPKMRKQQRPQEKQQQSLLQQQKLEQESQRKQQEREKIMRKREASARPQAAEGVAFNWRQPAQASKTPVDLPSARVQSHHIPVAGLDEPAAAAAAISSPRKEAAANARNAPAFAAVAAPAKQKQQDQLSFFDALSHAAAGEAAALAAGVWDSSTWGISGLYHPFSRSAGKTAVVAPSPPSVAAAASTASTATAAAVHSGIAEQHAAASPAREKQSSAGSLSAADSQSVAAADNAAAIGATAADNAATVVRVAHKAAGAVMSPANSFPVAASETDFPQTFAVEGAGGEHGVAAQGASPSSLQLPLSEQTVVAAAAETRGSIKKDHAEAMLLQPPQHVGGVAPTAAAAGSAVTSEHSSAALSTRGEGTTWADAISSFFQKLDERVEDAHGMLSHNDLYESLL